ncbi:phospholipase D-like domain-containing protein [Streptomyces xanthochromogenes]|uniref:hypothetical protein n=1 Tax=Streptomyces xanthochromogenes TaxID=67384 RepID=UPI0037F214F0
MGEPGDRPADAANAFETASGTGTETAPENRTADAYEHPSGTENETETATATAGAFEHASGTASETADAFDAESAKELSPEAVDVYGRVTRHEPIDPGRDARALGELRRWGLVITDPHLPHLPIALDPQEAGRRRLDEELRRMAARAALAARIPQLTDELGLHFERAKWRSGRGSEFLGEAELVNARIEQAVGRARAELLTAQPGGPRTGAQRAAAEERDGAALARGVHVRSLYLDTGRDDATTRAFVRAMTGRGAQFRTQVTQFQRCVVIDRRQAFISDHVVNSVPGHASWHVRDRAVVAFIAEVFEECWRRADPWHGDPHSESPRSAGPDGTRTTLLQREILRDMARGIEQRLTAQRLGIGLRSLSKEVRALRQLFGASTLQELTYQWALSDERLIDDRPPHPGRASA